jgi:streptomycin 6-kinase
VLLVGREVKDKMKGRLLLDVVVREGMNQVLSSEDKVLLVERDTRR